MSKEQLAEATQRVKAAGLSGRVTLLFCDYRYTATRADTPLSYYNLKISIGLDSMRVHHD